MTDKAPAGEPMEDEYGIEKEDGSEYAKVPKWLYDHVIEIETLGRDLRAKVAALTARAEAAEALANENEGAFKVWRRRCGEAESERDRLRAALEVAKEAMDERRSYVNGGDPSTCWQEMKYGEEWDAEDRQVAEALEVK